MADFAEQRHNMVESQIRPSDVTDRRIIRAMSVLPRERFLPISLRTLAYMDDEVFLPPTSAGGAPRALMAPRTLAKLIQLAHIDAGDVVLAVGCNSGYSAALLGQLAETVVALESDPEHAETATKVLADLDFGNVAVVTGPLAEGYPDEGPYDAIFVDGRVEEMPAAILDQLKDGGRLVAVSGAHPYSRASLWRRVGANFDPQEEFAASAPLLPGFAKTPTFVF